MRQQAVLGGLVAGLAGVAAMTAAEKLEQAVTRRPNSYVPAHTLERLLRLPHKPDSERRGLNWAMHWGQGILLGATRGLMAERGLRGPVGSFLFLNLRLLNDQTLENATGVGAPPWTWPVDEQVIDLMHKGIYAFATGLIADRLVAGPPGSRAARTVGGSIVRRCASFSLRVVPAEYAGAWETTGERVLDGLSH